MLSLFKVTILQDICCLAVRLTTCRSSLTGVLFKKLLLVHAKLAPPDGFIASGANREMIKFSKELSYLRIKTHQTFSMETLLELIFNTKNSCFPASILSLSN